MLVGVLVGVGVGVVGFGVEVGPGVLVDVGVGVLVSVGVGVTPHGIIPSPTLFAPTQTGSVSLWVEYFQ